MEEKRIDIGSQVQTPCGNVGRVSYITHTPAGREYAHVEYRGPNGGSSNESTTDLRPDNSKQF